jgi:RNA polymerase sigma factor (sigma-70 family)
MVWGLSQRLLRDTHDAEDVFQTTFLVLLRKAHAIVDRERVGSWTYRVAYHAALKARTRSVRRRTRETSGKDMSAAVQPYEDGQDEMSALLDQEINRLSKKYHDVVSLCYLQGKTNEQAALELGCPVGTVAGRLSRARDQLRGRLAQCSVALSSVYLANVLTPDALAKAVPPPLLYSTVKAASALAANGAMTGAFASSVHALAGEVIGQMAWRKLKLVAVCLLGALTLAGSGVAVYRTYTTRPGSVAEVAAPEPAKPPEIARPITVRSGPQEGQSLRGRRLQPLHLNGPDKGSQACLINKCGPKPVVMIFARDANASTQQLIQKLDAACTAHADRFLKSFVVFDQSVPGLQQELERWLATTAFKEVIITVGRPALFQQYDIREQVAVTIVLYKNSTVVANHAFEKGPLADADNDKILEDLRKILP